MQNLSLALQSCTAERDPGRLPALVDAAQLIAPQVKESHTQRSERVTTEGALPEAVQATSDSSIEPENQILNITAQPEVTPLADCSLSSLRLAAESHVELECCQSDASQLEEPLQGQSDPSHQATGTSDTPASPQDSGMKMCRDDVMSVTNITFNSTLRQSWSSVVKHLDSRFSNGQEKA